MAISPITQIITPIPPEREILVGQKNLPENIQWFASSQGMPLRSAEINAIITSFNAKLAEINSTTTNMNNIETSVTNKMNLTIQYEGITKGYVNTCLTYKTASETAYQNTVTLIENTDISGTAGYTIDAVDDLISRTKNLQFVGLN